MTDYKNYIVDNWLMHYYWEIRVFLDFRGYRRIKLVLGEIFKPDSIYNLRVFYPISISYVVMKTYVVLYHITSGFFYGINYSEKIYLFLYVSKLSCLQISCFIILSTIFKILNTLSDNFEQHHYDYIEENILKDDNHVRQILYNIDSNFIFVLAVFLGCFSFSMSTISLTKLTSALTIIITNLS